MQDERRRPPALYLIAALYLFSLLNAVSDYGYPFTFMGTSFQGGAAHCFVFADAMVSLYLIIGVLKRQRLTLWLAVAYNTLDQANALVNLALFSADRYAGLTGVRVSEGELRSDTLTAVLILLLLNVYLFINRRLFDNRSPYLF